MTLPPMISAKALGAMPQFVLDVAGIIRLERAMNAAELPFEFVDERSGYISENSLATFVHEAARAAGQQNIGLLWSPLLSVEDYGAWGTYVLSAPNLEAALQRASSVMPFHSSVDRATLDVQGTTSQYYYDFGLRGHIAYSDIGFSAIGVLLSIFRNYLGEDWVPSSVLLDFPKVPHAGDVEDTYQCPVIWNASKLAVEFATSDLHAVKKVSKRIVGPVTLQDVQRERLGGPPTSIIGQVETTIRLQLQDHEVSLDSTARSLGLGVRTLQRRLGSEGVRFRQIVNDVRICRAKELLSERSLNISSIATQLGYDSANNFSRAFKARTGASPNQYRNLRHNVRFLG